MTQFRIARISLILAAIGLNAAPALLPSAFAQTAPAAAAPQAEALRPELYKLLDPVKIKELMVAKKFDEVQGVIASAEAFPNRTPYENYVIERVKLALGSTTNNDKMAMSALEAVIASGRADKKDQYDFMQALANYYYNAKDYTKALEWFRRYEKESPTPEKVRTAIPRALYLKDDYANAKLELDKIVAAEEAAGRVPGMDELRLLASADAKLKDMDAYGRTIEKLAANYPTEEFWTDMLRRMTNRTSFNTRLILDGYRLESMALSQMTAEEYVEMTELALVAGYFTEAKNAMDAGYAKGVLGTGSNAAKHKQLRDKATKGAADDAKTIAAGEASARSAKTGIGMVNLGYAYVTMDQFDKGIELMEKGIAKGGLKNPDDAKLHLGVAYAKAGRKADAIKIFETLKGNDGMGDLARYWIMFLNRKPMAPAAK